MTTSLARERKRRFGIMFVISGASAVAIAGADPLDIRMSGPVVVLLLVSYAVTLFAEWTNVLLVTMSIVPWWTVLGSAYLHGPIVALIPLADRGGQPMQFIALVLGCLAVSLFALWFCWSRNSSVIARYGFAVAILGLFIALYPFRYGLSWHVMICLEAALFVQLNAVLCNN